ncbi:alpha/beta hydrolase [Prauserella rugosa]|uniref:Alpha/beta hydrolase family protein n=1 Tax=Prauserella rugosa TaxID=43354 RepID=A0A660CI50_9PSEU|nr:alpha/beta hydrolase [Prauserella rugosa]TWH21517.1 alpha/beta hydrolase family protein [Prauserella rugosa]
MRRTASSLTGAVIAGVATVVVSGLTTVMPAAATTPSSDGHTAVDRLAWGPCPGDMDAPKLECSTLRVPLDYRQPDGTQIDIAVSRLPSADPSKRRGVLLTNPGGPGGPGLEYPAQLAAGLPPQVLESYDVIGFDPRGVGESTPVTCELTEAQLTRGAFPAYAESRADVPKAARYARTIAEQCASSPTAGLHQHITTANTARDMDRIREALGESDVSYLGASYGTYLGAVYTTMFPQRSDRIVLDSNLGPGGYDVTAMRGFARGLQDRFPDFAEFAAARPEYGLGTTEAAVTAKFYELVDRLDEKPVHGIDGLALRGMTFTYTYADAQFSHLAEVWQAVDTGSPLPEFPAPPSSDMENLQAARLVVTCGDSRWPDKVRDYQRAVAVDRTLYPMLGGSTANIGPCAFWPDERPEAPVQIGDRGPSNVLMVQNERDPGTPLAGALKLRSAFGNRATMVTADQGGHGVYPFSANTCAVDAVTEFLTTGQRPAHDLACAAETREQSR